MTSMANLYMTKSLECKKLTEQIKKYREATIKILKLYKLRSSEPVKDESYSQGFIHGLKESLECFGYNERILTNPKNIDRLIYELINQNSIKE